MAQPVTVGIDIGTSSVKAIAADPDGNVVASARIPHAFSVPAPLQFEHDARTAWFDGPRAALDALGAVDAVGVAVAAMVPSLTAVDAEGNPCAPGLLYGDERGSGGAGNPVESGEFGRFLGWLASEVPAARGYWPAQAVANFALCGEPVMSTTAAALAYPCSTGSGGTSRHSSRSACGSSRCRRLRRRERRRVKSRGDRAACSRAERSTRWGADRRGRRQRR